MAQEGNRLPFQAPQSRPPIKLRRTHIQQNLKTLSTNRQLAQEMYYGNSNGQSVLTRSNANVHDGKQPVHQRLGMKRRLIRRNANNNNASANKKKIRLRRTNPTQGTRNSIPPVLNRLQYQRYMHLTQSATKPRHRKLTNPTNFTVQVHNPNFKTPSTVSVHSVQGSLNPQVQFEIRTIQNQSTFTNVLIPSEPIIVPGHGFTGIFQHDRFSRLP